MFFISSVIWHHLFGWNFDWESFPLYVIPWLLGDDQGWMSYYKVLRAFNEVCHNIFHFVCGFNHSNIVFRVQMVHNDSWVFHGQMWTLSIQKRGDRVQISNQIVPY